MAATAYKHTARSDASPKKYNRNNSARNQNQSKQQQRNDQKQTASMCGKTAEDTGQQHGTHERQKTQTLSRTHESSTPARLSRTGKRTCACSAPTYCGKLLNSSAIATKTSSSSSTDSVTRSQLPVSVLRNFVSALQHFSTEGGLQPQAVPSK